MKLGLFIILLLLFLKGLIEPNMQYHGESSYIISILIIGYAPQVTCLLIYFYDKVWSYQ